MIDLRSRKGAATLGLSSVMAIVGVGGGVFKLPVLAAMWATVWANAGTLSTLTSVLAFIARQVDALPESPFLALAIGAAAVYVTKLGLEMLHAFQKRYKE